MNPVNKLIFNAIASHAGVTLPGIGTLTVERRAAQLHGRKKLTPPHNAIVFSTVQKAVSIVELINLSVSDMAQSEVIYNVWENEAVALPNMVTIEGVGEVRNNSFVVDPALDLLLNPDGLQTIKLSPRSGKAIWIVCLALLLVGTGGYFVADLFFHSAQNSPSIVNTPVEPVEVVQYASDSIVNNDITESSDSATLSLQASGSANPAETVNAATPQGDVYHLVMGVFSTQENVDKFIKQLAKDSSISCTVVTMGNGKLIVSGYSSPEKKVVDARRKELTGRYPELWIYKQRNL